MSVRCQHDLHRPIRRNVLLLWADHYPRNENRLRQAERGEASRVSPLLPLLRQGARRTGNPPQNAMRELETENAVTDTLSLTKEELYALIDILEKEFEDCRHPYAKELGWCNVCGAVNITSELLMVKPHWRDIIARVLLRR